MEREKLAGDYKWTFKMSKRVDCFKEVDRIIHCYISQ